jgi:hypothetical protein
MAYAQIEMDEVYRYFIVRTDPDTHEEWRAPLVEIPDDLLDAYSAASRAEYALRRHIIDTYGTSYGERDD